MGEYAHHRPHVVFWRGRADLARVLYHAVHDARHSDDLFRDHSNSGGSVRKFPDSAHDWRGRHGIPHAQYVELLVHVARVSADWGQFFHTALWCWRRLDLLSTASDIGGGGSGKRDRS